MLCIHETHYIYSIFLLICIVLASLIIVDINTCEYKTKSDKYLLWNCILYKHNSTIIQTCIDKMFFI